LCFHTQLNVAVALAACQCHAGIGGSQARTRGTQIGTLLRIERALIGPARGVWPRIIGAEVMAVVTSKQHPQHIPRVTQIQCCLARRVCHS
ncbi:hypothetical protein NY997_22445, partial [Escherichia coli]|uniref:hypothetical protein n=1 Tax=Escherichia coli TaxID=562 RepID=UPI0022F0C79E